MDNFNKLKSIIQSKKNAITNVFVDSETNNKSISENYSNGSNKIIIL